MAKMNSPFSLQAATSSSGDHPFRVFPTDDSRRSSLTDPPLLKPYRYGGWVELQARTDTDVREGPCLAVAVDGHIVHIQGGGDLFGCNEAFMCAELIGDGHASSSNSSGVSIPPAIGLTANIRIKVV